MKQQAIQEAYGEHWEAAKDYVDQNGWIEPGTFDFNNTLNTISANFKLEVEFKEDIRCSDHSLYRPKSLQGIENNNGWIKIESEEDLPNDETLEFKVGAMVSNKFHLSCGVYDYNEVNFSFQNKYITHYQIIPKPKPPIF
jgi:hypothetical protein